jgi:hypothetical protein
VRKSMTSELRFLIRRILFFASELLAFVNRKTVAYNENATGFFATATGAVDRSSLLRWFKPILLTCMNTAHESAAVACWREEAWLVLSESRTRYSTDGTWCVLARTTVSNDPDSPFATIDVKGSTDDGGMKILQDFVPCS